MRSHHNVIRFVGSLQVVSRMADELLGSKYRDTYVSGHRVVCVSRHLLLDLAFHLMAERYKEQTPQVQVLC